MAFKTKRILKKIVSQYENEVDAVAISTAGTVDDNNIKITGSVGNLPEGYEKTDFQSLSSKRVFVVNDANAAVWAEYKVGNAKGKKNTVLLTLGTGVGVGLIVNGRLVTGKSGAAGEVHFPIRLDKKRRCGCGNYDCLEIYMSGKALNLDAKEFFKDDNATSYDVIAGVKENRHSEHLRSFVEGIISFEVVGMELFVWFQADESHLAQRVDFFRFIAVEVEESEGEEEAVVPPHRLEQLFASGELDVVERADAGEVHQPDLLEDAGVDDLVEPLRMVRQMGMGVDEFHKATPVIC